MVDSDHFSGRANKVMEDGSQITRSASDIENFSSRVKERKKVFCSVCMLSGKHISQVCSIPQCKGADHVWSADGSAVSDTSASDTYEPRISWIIYLCKTQLRRILVCTVLVQDVTRSVDARHRLRVGITMKRISLFASSTRNQEES